MTRTGRVPVETHARRVEALATLPMFHKLHGRKAVVAGHSNGAVWKAELLAAAGADVLVLAEAHASAYDSILNSLADGTMCVVGRKWRAEDLSGAAVAVGDFEEDDLALAFQRAARSAGAVVNIIDKPALCDAQFGALVNRSPLVIAISTDGGAPVFAQAIRTRIETLLPHGLKVWAEAARAWRPWVSAQKLPDGARRSFWKLFADMALCEPTRAPSESDRAGFLLATEGTARQPLERRGSVILVGAGPGDPELLTIKAMRALQSADVILYDDLVSAPVLELARREAQRILVGKTGHAASCKQNDINTLMVSLAHQGKRVVRLKGGDPLLFGRASEEIESCRSAGVSVEVVPGITSAQGAAASLGVSLTQRGVARRVQFVTGHGADGRLPEDIDWQAIARRDVTTVVFMPRRTLASFCMRSIVAGLPPDTPAVAVQSATRANEVRLVSTIESLPDRLSELVENGPVIVLLGAALADVSALGEQASMVLSEPVLLR